MARQQCLQREKSSSSTTHVVVADRDAATPIVRLRSHAYSRTLAATESFECHRLMWSSSPAPWQGGVTSGGSELKATRRSRAREQEGSGDTREPEADQRPLRRHDGRCGGAVSVDVAVQVSELMPDDTDRTTGVLGVTAPPQKGQGFFAPDEDDDDDNEDDMDKPEDLGVVASELALGAVASSPNTTRQDLCSSGGSGERCSSTTAGGFRATEPLASRVCGFHCTGAGLSAAPPGIRGHEGLFKSSCLLCASASSPTVTCAPRMVSTITDDSIPARAPSASSRKSQRPPGAGGGRTNDERTWTTRVGRVSLHGADDHLPTL